VYHLLLKHPENGGSKLLRNTGTYISVYTAPYPRNCKYLK